ncbi:hypothetical protein BGY98DRAFT_437227 [Russula aff. rugulosa BPL654]|nr:hypothetical protein BGY98DRAFT_437227 [Russula aff. rugulosa BPL654]
MFAKGPSHRFETYSTYCRPHRHQFIIRVFPNGMKEVIFWNKTFLKQGMLYVSSSSSPRTIVAHLCARAPPPPHARDIALIASSPRFFLTNNHFAHASHLFLLLLLLSSILVLVLIVHLGFHLGTSQVRQFLPFPDEEDGQHRSAPQSHISAHVGTARRALVHASSTESDVSYAASARKRASQIRASVGVVDVYLLAMLSMRDGVAGGDGSRCTSILTHAGYLPSIISVTAPKT